MIWSPSPASQCQPAARSGSSAAAPRADGVDGVGRLQDDFGNLPDLSGPVVYALDRGPGWLEHLLHPPEGEPQPGQNLGVLEQAGLVSRSEEGHRSPVHLEAEVFDLMTKWIERYRQRAEARYRELDAVLAEMDDDEAGQRPAHEETA